MTDKIDQDNDSSIVESIFCGSKKDETLSVEFFRKYISYVRKHKPKRKEELLINLQNFYNKIRGMSISKDSRIKGMPVTPRLIEGVLRLAEANAKIRLSEYVEEEDLNVAQDLFFNSLVTVFLFGLLLPFLDAMLSFKERS
jgi:DNA replicative helicase MCM subunit Mcm2 (Cdc46/Mcm family)